VLGTGSVSTARSEPGQGNTAEMELETATPQQS